MFPGVGVEGDPHFLLVLLLAVLVGGLSHRAGAVRAGVDSRELRRLVTAVSVVALLGSKAYSLVVDGAVGPLFGILSDRFRYPGSLLAVLLFRPWLRRLAPRGCSLARCADLMVPGTSFALAVIRIDCVIAGCCAGGVCSLPWGVRYPARSTPWFHQVGDGTISAWADTSLPVHPLPVYFMLLALVVGLVCLSWTARARYDGQVVLLFLLLHESGKLLLELLRLPKVPALQVASLCLALASGGLLFVLARRAPAGQRGPLGARS